MVENGEHTVRYVKFPSFRLLWWLSAPDCFHGRLLLPSTKIQSSIDTYRTGAELDFVSRRRLTRRLLNPAARRLLRSLPSSELSPVWSGGRVDTTPIMGKWRTTPSRHRMKRLWTFMFIATQITKGCNRSLRGFYGCILHLPCTKCVKHGSSVRFTKLCHLLSFSTFKSPYLDST